MLAHRAQCRFAEQVPERRRRTVYHRLRGKSWNHEMVDFGEKVRKALTKEYKLDGRWGEGYFRGENRRVLDCQERRNLQGKRDPKSWRSSAVGCRRAVAGQRRTLRILVKFVYDGWTLPYYPSQLLLRTTVPREDRARLKEDFYKFGFTDRCLGCQAIIQGGETRPHTEHC